MNGSKLAEAGVELRRNAVRINGQSVVLLSSSLFYFRIPAALWRERMRQLKALHYNAIDVYFPWNYHELREGEWDFAGERDAERFLRIAAEEGLWVVARPGPYICSEWDGGALPAYLLAKPNIRLRDNDPVFLHYTSLWFDRILPIVARHQAGAGGSVVCVQLDNELDFYECEDPAGYISALRDMAVERGISVPLIACAGQGGVVRATGLADGVVPTCNFYPDNRDPAFEAKALHYEKTLAGMGYPLLVTETNRNHFLLRRLLSCGAKLLGPYLQASGTDYGFTNATNNWGKPLAFLASDYDFGGMISPEGHLREEAYEGRLLGRLIRTYGEALAEAAPQEEAGWTLTGDGGTDGIFGPYALRLKGGGSLLFVANGGEATKEVALRNAEGKTVPGEGTMTLAGGQSVALPFDVQLSMWGMPDGRLVRSTAELYWAEQDADGTVLVFHAEQGTGEIVLAVDSPAVIETEQADADCKDGLVFVRTERGGAAFCKIRTGNGGLLTLIVTDKMKALHMEAVEADGSIRWALPSAANRSDEGSPTGGERQAEASEPAIESSAEGLPSDERQIEASPSADERSAESLPLTAERQAAAPPSAMGWRFAEPPNPAEPPDQAERVAQGRSRASLLEPLGVYRGFAWYEAAAKLMPGQRVRGILLRQASDVVSLYACGRYIGTAVPGGSRAYLPIGGPEAAGTPNPLRLQARVEIWGHSNFDDPRLPSLRLNALKGLAGMTAVTAVRDISANWAYRHGRDGANYADNGTDCATRENAAAGDELLPLVHFGGWLTRDHPARGLYRRQFLASADADRWTLRFDGLQAEARLTVNGHDAGEVDVFDPFVDLTPFVKPGEPVELAVDLVRRWGLPAGRVIVYEGTEAEDYSVSAAEERELIANAQAWAQASAGRELPLSLEPGAVGWLFGSAANSAGGRGWRVRAAGSGLKLTVLFAGRIVGRLWLPGSESSSRPAIAGGSPDSFYLPGPWFEEAGGGALSILLEAVDREPGRLESLAFIPV